MSTCKLLSLSAPPAPLPPAPRSPSRPISARTSRKPTSGPGTSPFCPTVQTCRQAAEPPAQGAAIYAQQCALCHGDNGVKPQPGYSPMVGLHKFDRMDAPKTITYYEHATTIFDIVRRGMPFMAPRTLSDDQVYAITAYLLAINKLIDEKDVMNAQTLPKVKMPNAGKFIIRFPDRI